MLFAFFAGALGRKQLAKEVIALRHSVSQQQEVARMEATEHRRLEQELLRCRQSLLKAEELMNIRERTQSPNM